MDKDKFTFSPQVEEEVRRLSRDEMDRKDKGLPVKPVERKGES